MQKTIIPVQDWFAVIYRNESHPIQIEAVRVVAFSFGEVPEAHLIEGKPFLASCGDGDDIGLVDAEELSLSGGWQFMCYVHERDLPEGIPIRNRLTMAQMAVIASGVEYVTLEMSSELQGDNPCQ